MKKITLLIADDHAVLRAGLKALLSSQDDIEVVADASNGEEAVRKARAFAPDIVLMDISMPGLNGLEATREIVKQSPAAKVLVLTMHEEEGYLNEMLSAGASGYIPKKAADTELLHAIRATHQGESFIHSSMTASMVARMRSNGAPPKDRGGESGRLSQREKHVLRLLARGYANQEIADRLFLSVKTIETYKARIKEKLGLHGRAELVRYATETGLVDLNAPESFDKPGAL